MGDTTDNAIGNNIRAVRVDAGLTQTEFAKRLQVSQTTVSSWETGSSQPRRSNLFILLSEFPGLTLEDINSEKNGFAAGLFAARAIRNLSKHLCSGAWRRALRATRSLSRNTSLCRIRCTSVTRTRFSCACPANR